MTQKTRVLSAVSTHFPNKEDVKVEDSESGVRNHQQDEHMLSYPEESDGQVSTHSAEDPKFKGAKKPVAAALHDAELPPGGKIAQIPNEVDPSVGYLEKESGMPVIQNAGIEDDTPETMEPGDTVQASEDDDEEFVEDDVVTADEESDEEEDEFSEVTADDEFGDLAEMEMGESDEGEEVHAEDMPETEEAEPVFDELPDTEAIAVVDVDGMDDSEAEGCAFATMANVIHVIKGNRIIASMTPANARRVGMEDVYLTEQYQDVVAHAMETRGIRKGLVQSGFVLSKVRVGAAKAQAKVIKSKVEAALAHKAEAAAKADKAMDQALAIAAVGINRRFFKDTPNELKAGLEAELQRLGVRGGSNLVRAMFAQHGVSYARAIVTLAKKLAAMPEETRDQFADALDLTEDSEFDTQEADVAEDEDGMGVEVEDDFEPVPASVTAALLRPAKPSSGSRVVASSAAMSILSGNQSLV